MTQARKHNRAPRPAYSICREWRQVQLKCAYEVSILDEHDDDGTARIVDLADATQRELERDLTDAAMVTVYDPHSVLGIALCLLREGWGAETERVEHLIQVARHGLITISNATERRAAA